MKILFAEDEPDIQFVARIALEDEGHQIVTVEDGQAAFERAVAEPFDVILLDVMMPRLDGLGACQKLQSDLRTRSIPVIFLTVGIPPEKTVEALRLGVNGIVLKEGEPAELLHCIESVMRGENRIFRDAAGRTP